MSSASSQVDAQIAEGRRVNNNARNTAVKDYQNAMADLVSARDSSAAALTSQAASNRGRIANIMASRGMDVGEGAAMNFAQVDQQQQANETSLQSTYNRGAQSVGRSRDDRFAQVNEADRAMMNARAGQIAALQRQMDAEARATALQNAQMQQLSDAHQAQLLATDALKNDPIINGIKESDFRKNLYEFARANPLYGLPEFARYARAAGRDLGSKEYDYYGLLSPLQNHRGAAAPVVPSASGPSLPGAKVWGEDAYTNSYYNNPAYSGFGNMLMKFPQAMGAAVLGPVVGAQKLWNNMWYPPAG